MPYSSRLRIAVLVLLLATCRPHRATRVCDACATDDDCAGLPPGPIEGYCCVSHKCVMSPGSNCIALRAAPYDVSQICH